MKQNFSIAEIEYLRHTLNKYSANYTYWVTLSNRGNIQIRQYKRWTAECTGRLFTITREYGDSGDYVLRNRNKGTFYGIPYIMFRNSDHDCCRPDVDDVVKQTIKQTIEWKNSRGRFHTMIDLCERMKEYWCSGNGKVF